MSSIKPIRDPKTDHLDVYKRQVSNPSASVEGQTVKVIMAIQV